jgi:hypothetical protein
MSLHHSANAALLTPQIEDVQYTHGRPILRTAAPEPEIGTTTFCIPTEHLSTATKSKQSVALLRSDSYSFNRA